MRFVLCNCRYEMKPEALRIARIATGLTLKGFAAECGWSFQYQSRLETIVAQISEGSARIIIDVLKQHNVNAFLYDDPLRLKFNK